MSVQHITKEEFETIKMKDRVAAYHETLNKHINGASEYASGEDGDDFVKDDVAVPTGYVDEGDYFGPPGVPDNDDVIDNENERMQSD